MGIGHARRLSMNLHTRTHKRDLWPAVNGNVALEINWSIRFNDLLFIQRLAHHSSHRRICATHHRVHWLSIDSQIVCFTKDCFFYLEVASMHTVLHSQRYCLFEMWRRKRKNVIILLWCILKQKYEFGILDRNQQAFIGEKSHMSVAIR